jgi:hypothetical protein
MKCTVHVACMGGMRNAVWNLEEKRIYVGVGVKGIIILKVI